ncbi:MAG TPA: FliH/SctL family protein [Solirubrobacterales bacterium]|jgi:flagellar assembly protein FliH
MSSSFEFPELAVPRPVEEQLEAAEAQHESELQAARAAGYEEGRAAGRAEVSAAAHALAMAAAELDAARSAAAADAEPVAVELAFQIAAKVLGGELEARPEAVLDVVRGALRRLTEPLPATILVNPEDAELVRDSIADFSVEHGGELSVREDRRVERGGCVVRTAAGEVDAQISAQLERAAKVVARAPEAE